MLNAEDKRAYYSYKESPGIVGIALYNISQ